ncbi:MAG TPA: helix-turn-helix domain-containing protein [Desulfosporosinus sp.]|nr:helix-turn-helix domain-containing protein [Desulfosporosinus sp.]
MPIKKQTIFDECSMCSQPEEMKIQMCSVCVTQKIIRGKWKIVIIWLLRDGEKRFSELQRNIPRINQSYLTHQLKELEYDGLLNRKAYNVIPPKVEYSLTQKGIDFIGVMEVMDNWGKQYILDFKNGNI